MGMSSDPLKFLNERMEEPIVAWMSFIRKFKKDDNRNFCFVEGEDDNYYRLRINYVSRRNNSEFIRCNGKNGVIEIYNTINNHTNSIYKNANTFFFLDKDFDSNLKENIYVTPCYSIENFYTSTSAYKKIVKAIFRLDEDENPEDFKTCIDLFENTQMQFHETILDLNAWLLCQSEKSLTFGPSNLNLRQKDKDIKNNFFTINLETVQKNYDINEIVRIFPNAHKISSEELSLKKNYLIKRGLQESLRGKYEIYFLEKFLSKISSELRKKDSRIFIKKYKHSFNSRDNNLMLMLSEFADTPRSLENYIKLRIMEIRLTNQ